MTNPWIALTMLCMGTISSCTPAKDQAEADYADDLDVVILNGRVMDPETDFDAVRNVGVKDGRIAVITEQKIEGKKSIDARGHVVAPGFIDLHAHGQNVGDYRMQAMQGVTTMLELESGVLPIAEWYEKHFQDAQSRTDWKMEIATPEQLAQILALVDEGLNQGGLGIGINAGYAPGHGRKEYFALAELAAKRDVATFTHVRYASNMEPRSSFEAVQELIANAAITGAHMHLCHTNSTLLKLDKRNYSQEKTHETKQRNTTGIC